MLCEILSENPIVGQYLSQWAVGGAHRYDRVGAALNENDLLPINIFYYYCNNIDGGGVMWNINFWRRPLYQKQVCRRPHVGNLEVPFTKATCGRENEIIFFFIPSSKRFYFLPTINTSLNKKRKRKFNFSIIHPRPIHAVVKLFLTRTSRNIFTISSVTVTKNHTLLDIRPPYRVGNMYYII